MKTARRARLDACCFQPDRHAVIAYLALENLARGWTEFRNVERATGHAISAPDAMRFLEIDDAVRVLNDGGVRRTGRKATRIFAMHALVLAHQQHHAAIVALMLVELDQVPVIPCGLRHRLVGVIKGSFGKRVTVPFEAGHLTSFAADASTRVDECADPESAVQIRARNRPGVAGDSD